MTYTRVPLAQSPVLRRARERRQCVSLWFAALRAAVMPPDPSVEAFRQVFADTIKQQERKQ